MRKVSQINIKEILKKYFNYKEEDFVLESDNKNRKIYKTICPIHKEQDPSFKIYEKNGVYDCICYSKRDAGNNAVQLLCKAGKAKTPKDAEELLKKDFGITPPEVMNVAGLAEYKGFSEEFLQERGFKDENGRVMMPFHSIDGKIIAEKLRCSYEKVEGKAKFIWKVQDENWYNPYYGLDLVGKAANKAVLDILEGETDALTMQMLGYTAIGIVGADTFKEEKSSFMDEFDRLVVTKDNDVAGLKLALAIANSFPEKTYIRILPKEVKDVNSLFLDYCTEDKDRFLDFLKRLPVVPATKQAFLNEVARDPSYAYNEDAIGFLASVMSDVEMEILKTELKETKGIAKRAIDKLFKQSKSEAVTWHGSAGIREEDNAYVKPVLTQAGYREDVLSNFVLQPVAYFHMPDGRNREFILSSRSGYVSEPVMFRAEELTSLSLFKKKCFEVGDFIFTGSKEDFDQVMLYILDNSEDVMDITLPATVGRQQGCWLFGNTLVKDGDFYMPDEDNNFKVDGTTFRPRSIYSDSSTRFIPVLDLKTHLERDIQLKAIHLLDKSYGNTDVVEALGWLIANAFSEKVVETHNGFPILFITGRSGSGKSTFARHINCALNVNNTRADSFNSSVVGMSRMMAYYSNIPVWYDEYRENDRNIQYKTQFLKEAFERQGVSKGTKVASVVQKAELFSTVILSGEDTPEDRGLLSRCFLIKLDRTTNNQRIYQEFKEYENDLFKVVAREAVRLSTVDGEYIKFNKILKSRRKELIDSGADDRTAFLRAVTYAGIVWMFPELETLVRNNQELSVQGSLAEIAEFDPVNIMLEDFATMILEGRLLPKKHYIVNKQGIGFTSFRSLYNAWASYLAEARNSPPHSVNTMKEYCLKSEVVEYKSVKLLKQKSPIKAYMFQLEKLKSTMLQEKILDIMFTEEAIDIDERRLLATELGLDAEEIDDSEF